MQHDEEVYDNKRYCHYYMKLFWQNWNIPIDDSPKDIERAFQQQQDGLLKQIQIEYEDNKLGLVASWDSTNALK